MDKLKTLKREKITKDNNTGGVNITESIFNVAEVEKNKEFAMFFGEKIAEYLKLNNQQKNVLAVLSLNMELATNVVLISAPRRQAWAQQIGISVQAFNSAMSRLMESGVVVKHGNGEYMIDPHIYSRSNFADRLKSKQVFTMKLMFEFDTRDGCKVRKAGVETEDLKPINMKTDLETGEILYQYRKGMPYESRRHTRNESTESR